MSDKLALLEAIMVEEDDLELFPEAVLQAHRRPGDGPLQARKLLIAANKREQNDARRAKQKHLIHQLRLWSVSMGKAPSMYTFNGIGTRVYGRYQKHADGTSIGTHWFTLLYIPFLPLGAYLFSDAGGNSYHFHARTPMPPGRWVAPAAWASLVALGTGAVVVGDTVQASRADVIAYNGFSTAIEIRTDDDVFEVGPRDHARFVLSASDVRVQTAFQGEADPFEEVVLPLSLGGRSDTVYNVGGRAVLLEEWIVYGEGVPQDAHLLVDPVTIVDDLDYVFSEPPDAIDTSLDSVTRSILGVYDDPDHPHAAMMGLLADDEADAAFRLGRSALREGKGDQGVMATCGSIAQMEPDGARRLCDELIEEAPGDVHRHRYCQDVGRFEGWDQRETYASLAQAQPDSAMHQYLWSRLADNDEKADILQGALRADPDYPWTHLALAYHHQVVTGRFDEALEHYERLWVLDPQLGADRQTEMVRLHRLLNKAVPSRVLDLDPSPFSLADMLALEDDPSTLDDVRGRIETDFEANPDPTVSANVVANAALIAGDLDLLREMNARGAGLDLWLAMSDGATKDDMPAQLLPGGRAYAVMSWLAATQHDMDPAPHLEAVRPYSAEVAQLLAGGVFDRATVADALVGAPQDLHAAVWFAAWRLTGDRTHRDQARRWAVPAELPWMQD